MERLTHDYKKPAIWRPFDEDDLRSGEGVGRADQTCKSQQNSDNNTYTSTMNDVAYASRVVFPWIWMSDRVSAFSLVPTNKGLMTDSGAVAEDKRKETIRSSIMVRRRVCPFPGCGVTFVNNGQLAGHIRVHTGCRPYRCEVIGCAKAFARNEELTRHRRIHSGDKPHECDVCHKHFGRRDHLNKHRKTHLKESEKKIYVCCIEGCGHRYTRTDALTRHQSTAHNIRPTKNGHRHHQQNTTAFLSASSFASITQNDPCLNLRAINTFIQYNNT